MTELLSLDPDQLLSTTRAVRKRLDLQRPVSREIVEECLEVAVQAPTGSNMQGWQWVFVDDADKKKALADMYGAMFDPYITMRTDERAAASPFSADDTRALRAEKVGESAVYLRQIFHEVPVLMIPLIEGRPDTSGSALAQASQWGSILPAVWSFLLALRARGLGSAWTTLHLGFEQQAADLLGIDNTRYTQAGLFPIAWTKGTDFKPAPRIPLETIVHWNSW